MTNLRFCVTLCLLSAAVSLVGCSRSSTKSPEVADGIRKSLEQAGLHEVSVSQDRDKGVVTLSGNVSADSDRAQAESIANSMAGGQVVADQIAVLPPGDTSDAKTINADLDKAIDKNVDAALVQKHLNKDVRYDVKNGVVTLKGTVNSDSRRAEVEKLASNVPNVRQVVNELEVRDRKATSSR